ncbi:MAG: hypothetical protein LBJ32_04175 [Oscillospiraceae bacterium]|jgi:hypothetical protein|nr:hypothetical protein [Oscillospiraceae bacterium]
MPHIIRFCDKHKVCTHIDFRGEFAALVAADSEVSGDSNSANPPMITVSCPIEKLEIRGANTIQALEGMQTYLRRYLYMAMFDITESDVFDASQGKSGVEKTYQGKKVNTEKPYTRTSFLEKPCSRLRQKETKILNALIAENHLSRLRI